MTPTTIILAVASLYSVTALGCWTLVNAPFATVSNFPYTLLWSIPVLAPYGFLFVLYYAYSDDRFLARPSAVASIVASVVAFPLYALSFSPNDGEYALVFMLVPMMQAVLAVIAISITWWRM